jgi:hypothetical protein
MTTTARPPTPAQTTVNSQVAATRRAAESGTFLHYIRRSSGLRRVLTPEVDAALHGR